MKAIIAEKPSVAREIAALVGATEKKDGYLEGKNYMVTWALGHLVGLAMPDEYGVKGFRKESLPILPDPFLLTIRKVKNDKNYVIDKSAKKQLKAIEYVLDRCDTIIVGTDAGREGELIFRHIYEYLKCTKPFQRLWISSLTEKAIRQGFDNLKDGSEFEGLFRAGQARSRADWLVGINASQALSISVGDGVYSLGRVQTPTLALICERYLENKSFEITKYWQLQLWYTKEFIDFKSTSKSKWQDQHKAEEAKRILQRSGTAKIVSVDKKTMTQQPPLLYDLTGLQKDANKKLNLSASQTLAIAQGLYEKKFISYPRTGSRHIPQDLWPEIPLFIKALEVKPACREAVEKIKYSRLNKRIVNDLRVTDHHGLLITEKIPTTLSADEEAIYTMIALRLIESVSQNCIKEMTHIEIEASHYDFILKGCKILEAGWRSIKGTMAEDIDEPIQELPDLKVGDDLKIKDIQVIEKKTKPPVLYTEAGILSAMETAGKEIESEEGRSALKGIGIGTPATRAAIIDTLFARDYIQKENKSLVPTDKGLQVYHLVKDKKISNVAMTAEWEIALGRIETGDIDAAVFQQQIEDYVSSITTELLDIYIDTAGQPVLTCPQCNHSKLIIRDKIVKCSDAACGWLQFRNICEVHMGMEEIERLVKNGKTGLIKGMTSKAGKKFDAYIVLDNEFKTYFDFPKYKAFPDRKRK